MATPEDFEALRARMASMSAEERQDILARALELRVPAKTHTLPLLRDEEGRTISGIPRMPLGVDLDPETPQGKINNAMLLASGTGGAVRGLVGSARAAGVPGLAKAGGGLLKRAAVYAGVGAGASQLPVVGGGDPRHGAELGVAVALGQGGRGALWKHGKKRNIIESVSKWLLKQFGGEADTAAKEVVEEIAKGAPKAAARGPKVAAKGATKAPTLDPAKGVDFNKAGGSKAQRAAVEAKAQIEGRGLRPGAGWSPEGSFEPVKAAAKAASPGAVRSAAHAAERKALEAFAKPLAKGHKFGEKVWIELNEAGEPIRVLTPGQASRVAESAKTWIKKLWRD